MTKFTTTWLLVLVLAVAGCSSTRDVSSPPAAAPERPPVAEAPRAAADTSSAQGEATLDLTAAPEDWHQLDAEADRLHGISLERAYETLLEDKEPRQTVIVAVIDAGVDTTHQDLSGMFWINQDEVPGNDRDDDQNGYADDVRGWNFIGGADGDNVTYDTYELTREYVRLEAAYADADTAALAPEAREEYTYYQKIKRAYEQRRTETQSQLAQLEMISQAVERATALFERRLGTEQLTPEALAALEPEDEGLRRAQALLLYLYEQGITAEDVEEQTDHLANTLDYGFDPNFNPRSIVGDDYDDYDERYYGNSDVMGPDPEHGTIVAGIIAAQRQNGLGIDGIAESVRIMSIRAVPNGDERDKDVANAIRYAVDNGADIINMSFGKSYSPQKEIVDEAVQYADENGVLMVHAAGNDGKNVDSTASYPTQYYLNGTGQAANWIEVGASSWHHGDSLVASFSNYGAQRVDVFAPGVDIYSTTPEQGYDRASGTSMAAPVVSGLAALIMSYYPDLSAEEVRDIILASAVKYPGEVRKPGDGGARTAFSNLSATGGVVNAYAALEMAAARSDQ